LLKNSPSRAASGSPQVMQAGGFVGSPNASMRVRRYFAPHEGHRNSTNLFMELIMPVSSGASNDVSLTSPVSSRKENMQRKPLEAPWTTVPRTMSSGPALVASGRQVPKQIKGAPIAPCLEAPTHTRPLVASQRAQSQRLPHCGRSVEAGMTRPPSDAALL
jgi:hypothetical protein